MTQNEITKIIDKKGIVVKEAFGGLNIEIMETLEDTYDFSDYDYECIENAVATMSYNCTIRLMNFVLENAVFFEKFYDIKERNRVRIKKDLISMPNHIDYPKELSDWDLEDVEENIVSWVETYKTKQESEKNYEENK